MRSLKILHILRAPIGGLFRHVADLAQGQIARGHHVGIIADSRTANTRSRELLSALTPKLALGVTLTPIYRPFGPNDLTALVHVIRRVRRDQNGREVVIIDNGFAGVRRADWFVQLPPPVVRIPRDRYIVQAGRATPAPSAKSK